MTKSPIGKVYVLDLPSGDGRVRARRPSSRTIIASGDLPADLLHAAMAMTGELGEYKVTPDTARYVAGFMDAYVRFVLVSPRVGDVTDVDEDAEGVLTGTVNLMDLRDDDKTYLFLFGQGKVHTGEEEQVTHEALRNFRDVGAGAAAGSGGEAVRAEAE